MISFQLLDIGTSHRKSAILQIRFINHTNKKPRQLAGLRVVGVRSVDPRSHVTPAAEAVMEMMCGMVTAEHGSVSLPEAKRDRQRRVDTRTASKLKSTTESTEHTEPDRPPFLCLDRLVLMN